MLSEIRRSVAFDAAHNDATQRHATMSSSNGNEITVTLVSPVGASESISVGKTSTTIKDLLEWCKALFGLNNNDNYALTKDGKALSTALEMTVEQAGIVHGDLLAIQETRTTTVRAPAPPTRTPAATAGLDFSSLLSSGPTATATATSSGVPPPVYYPGMSLDDAMMHNPHPQQFVSLIQQRDALFKELRYHDPRLAPQLRNLSLEQATSIWRETLVKGGIRGALQRTEKYHKEASMKQRLQQNPNDEEAKAYFKAQECKAEIDLQYRQMMNEYPESMGRVLMLYIAAKVNGHDIQAFVDSGAQSTIMSKKKAEECGVLHLVDERFAGVAVGVGTGKILGRIHLVSLQIGSSFFPCTVTVMDDAGLGDKNMDFLLGLDMQKRFNCNIDLEHHCVRFKLGHEQYMEAPFLHEKDLDETKGGTRGFNAEKANEELMKAIEKADKEDEEKGGGNNSKMEEN